MENARKIKRVNKPISPQVKLLSGNLHLAQIQIISARQTGSKATDKRKQILHQAQVHQDKQVIACRNQNSNYPNTASYLGQ